MIEQTERYHAVTDPDYQDPYIDVDEQRERTLPDGTPITYRYIHGGFSAKKVKFSFCFPAKEKFEGRFYQYLSPYPGPDEELASLPHVGVDDKIAFSLSHGAYFVETNMGSAAAFGGAGEPMLIMKASSAAAEFSRKLAMDYYGCRRPFGYVYGGSGGSYKTFSCIENSSSWDGAVPYVIGSPVSLPNTITLHAQGQRVLRKCFSKIVDALDAGGSGDPYAGLSETERDMLREVTAMGFPPRAWFAEAIGRTDDGSLPVLEPMIKAMDPQYFQDFWTIPGYADGKPDSGARRDRLQFDGIAKSVILPEAGRASSENGGIGADGRNGVDTAWQKMMSDAKGGAIELETVPAGDLYLKGCKIHIESGKAKGKVLLLDHITEHWLLLGSCYGTDDIPAVLSLIQPGDKIRLDNSDYIAIQSYYRHQVPDQKSFHAWDQFRDPDGKPTLPQRRLLPASMMTGTGGTVQNGNFRGKVIALCAMMDESSCPWCGDWYRQTVIEAKGSDKDFRLYYMDRCMHGDLSTLVSSRTVNYVGALHQALLDVAAWVERGIEPPETTAYRLRDGQILLPASARERGGIQSVVELLANGSACAHVKVNEPVHFTAKAEVPEGCGSVTRIAYCFSDSAELIDPEAYAEEGAITHSAADGVSDVVRSETTHTYDKPGVYFASACAAASRIPGDPYTQILNLGRARIIVAE